MCRLVPTQLALYACFIASLVRVVYGICYTPNGTATEELMPCNGTADVSLCCGAKDWCLSNGL
jgi:hypothetical protein